MKNIVKKGVQLAYATGDRVGLHVIPKHYYSPVPDRTWLVKNKALWMKPASMTGVKWDLDLQLEWLHKICESYIDEVQGFGAYDPCAETGLGYGPIESQVLHCFLRSVQPKHIIELGGGVSTCCMLQAIARNTSQGIQPTTLAVIEPYPSEFLISNQEIALLEEPCQSIDPEVFQSLQAGDLLFIDSSHAVKVGSDVVRIYTEILPSLLPGVVVHIHDIYLPYIYPRDTLKKFYGWQETAMVLALLIGNPNFEVLASLSALYYDRPRELSKILPDFRPQPSNEGLSMSNTHELHFPSSLWVRRK